MNDYRFPDNKLVKLCFPLFLLVLQMVSRSTLYTSTLLGFGKSQAIMIGTVLLIGIAFLATNRKKLKQVLTDRRMLLFVLAAAVVLGPMAVKRDWQMMYFTILLCWFFAIFLTYFTSVRELGRWYVLLMAFFSVLSLIGIFVLKPMVHAGLIPGHPFDTPGNWHMFNFGLIFVCDMNDHMDDALRAFGIFREPGLFQIFLFIAIHLNNDWVQWKKQWQMWVMNAILFVSMLTTFATGGVLALGLYIVFLFFEKGLYRDRRMQILAVLAVAAGVGLLIFALAQGGTWAYELIGMMDKIIHQKYSYTARIDSIVTDAKLFFASPLVGANMEDVVYAVVNNTATSPILFAVFGIVGGCIHVLSWVAFVWKKERHLLVNLLLMVILFIPFNTQNVMHDMFFWLFPIMALSEWCLTKMGQEKKVG